VLCCGTCLVLSCVVLGWIELNCAPCCAMHLDGWCFVSDWMSLILRFESLNEWCEWMKKDLFWCRNEPIMKVIWDSWWTS
jgi:hypothetical protein